MGENGAKRWLFAFTVLPFSRSTTPHVSTATLMGVLIRHWRANGIRCMAFMADGSGAGQSLAEASKVSRRIQSDIEKAGLIAHPEKSLWDPAQVMISLGYVIDLKEGQFLSKQLVLRSKSNTCIS